MWKKIVFAVFVFALFGLNPCSAQIPLRYGAKGGLNFADIQTQGSGAGGRRRALATGVFFMVDPVGTFAFQSELLYMGKGDSDEIFTEQGRTLDITLKINYIEVPLLVKLQAPLLGTSTVSLFGGPAFALKVSESLEDPKSDQTVTNIARPFDVGGAAGVQFTFGTREGRFLLEARMTSGLMKIKDGSYLRPGSTNHVFSIMMGFSL